MLNHVVLIQLVEGVGGEQVSAAVAALAALPDEIPELRSLSCGADAGINAGAVDLAFVASFDSVEDYSAYRAHPAHEAFARDVLRPITDSVTMCQFYSSPPADPATR